MNIDEKVEWRGGIFIAIVADLDMLYKIVCRF